MVFIFDKGCGYHSDANFERKLLRLSMPNLVLYFINSVLLGKNPDFNIIIVNI